MRLSKDAIFFLFIIVFLSSAFGVRLVAQPGWFQQESGTSLNLYSVRFLDQNIGWVVGDSGLILKTLNGGQNWTGSRYTNYLPLPLRALHFFDENTGVIVGGRYAQAIYDTPQRLIIRTTNGGNNWQIIEHSYQTPFRNIQFVNDETGFIGSNGVFKTTNRGEVWEHLAGISGENCFFIDDDTGYASNEGNSTIYKTMNGGYNWTIVYNSGIYNFGGPIFFANSKTGYVTGHSTIFRTSDGGVSWENKINEDFYFRDAIYFSDPNKGVILSNTTSPNYYTIIQLTTNGGNSWQNHYTSTRFYSVFFKDNNTGWIVGKEGKILKSTSGGTSSVLQSSQNIPEKFMLHQNYPNPFNPVTKIQFGIATTEFVNLQVFNVLGKELTTLVNEFLNAGEYSVEFNGKDFESGIYFYRIRIKEFTETKSMMILK